jgi:hypothetical protein
MTADNTPPSSNDPQDPAVAIAAARWAMESEKLRYPVQAAIELEVFKGANERGASAIKSSMIINGGSAVALLTLIGHLASIPNTHLHIKLITKALSFFVGGVWCALIATGLAYVTAICVVAKSDKKLSTSDRWKKRIARATNGLAILFVTVSIGCFTCGCWKSYFAILRFRPQHSTTVTHEVI